jgi:hypothetical protein
MSVLGAYLADPQQGPAGTNQLGRLVHCAKWCSRPGVFNKPGRPIVVRGWEWTAVLLCGLKGAVQVVSMRWWMSLGAQATSAREQEGQLLRECARRS